MCENSSTGDAIPTVYVDNASVRVTEWRFKHRGDDTGWHVHEYDYVVVPLFDGILDIDQPDGTRVSAELSNGVPYYRDLGVEHNVLNGNDFECAFIEIEVKR